MSSAKNVISGGAEVAQIAQLAMAGEKMVERLRKKAFLPDRRKELKPRSSSAAQPIA
jgi:hypothetical protein